MSNSEVFFGVIVAGAIALGVLLGLRILNPSGAAAAIRRLEEAPGQVVYQSRQTLKDQHGNGWQAVAFKRTRPNGQTSFELRLVGFPDVIAAQRLVSQGYRQVYNLQGGLLAWQSAGYPVQRGNRP